MKKTLLYAVLTVIVCTIAVLSWYAERYVHYDLSYEDKVKDTVKDMVKPECLRGP